MAELGTPKLLELQDSKTSIAKVLACCRNETKTDLFQRRHLDLGKTVQRLILYVKAPQVAFS